MKVPYRTFKGIFYALGLSLMSIATANAQRVSGVISDAETNELLPGATIAVKNQGRGTASDANGQFSIEARAGEELSISLVGYATQTLLVGASTTLNIGLSPDNKLQEVIVTALGISREKKSLGYSAQEVKGEDLTKARETNIINSLSGKIAGVTVVGNPSGIGASSRITIRGERSLNINRNQPLFVVDGVPISNELRGSSGNNFQEADYGNGAGFVNPDDVESITVLKGASCRCLVRLPSQQRRYFDYH
jgi:outer membrane receptor protein involved in Fe transport